jgi:hypothetical protein
VRRSWWSTAGVLPWSPAARKMRTRCRTRRWTRGFGRWRRTRPAAMASGGWRRGSLGYRRRARFCGGQSLADGQRVREREEKRGRPERRLGNALNRWIWRWAASASADSGGQIRGLAASSWAGKRAREERKWRGVNSTNVLDEGLRIGELGRRMNSKVKLVEIGVYRK